MNPNLNAITHLRERAREARLDSQYPGEREETFIGRVKKELIGRACIEAAEIRARLLREMDGENTVKG